MKVVNFWVDADGKEVVYYVMEFKDKDEKANLWEKFRSDPEWIKAKAGAYMESQP